MGAKEKDNYSENPMVKEREAIAAAEAGETPALAAGIKSAREQFRERMTEKDTAYKGSGATEKSPRFQLKKGASDTPAQSKKEVTELTPPSSTESGAIFQLKKGASDTPAQSKKEVTELTPLEIEFLQTGRTPQSMRNDETSFLRMMKYMKEQKPKLYRELDDYEKNNNELTSLGEIQVFLNSGRRLREGGGRKKRSRKSKRPRKKTKKKTKKRTRKKSRKKTRRRR